MEKKKQTVSRIEIPGHKASLLLTAFPGRTSANTFSVKKMVSVFSLLEKERCSHFLSLVEDDEFSCYCGKAVLEAETKKSRIIMYFYGTNLENFKTKDGYQVSGPYHLITWPHLLVWNNFPNPFTELFLFILTSVSQINA